MNSTHTRSSILLAAALVALPVTASAQTAKDYFTKAFGEAKAGEFDAAIADYDHAIALDPNYQDAFFGRGAAKRAKGDDDGAIADYSRAIELFPADGTSYGGRGAAKVAKGDDDGAISDLSMAIGLNPRDAISFLYRGSARFGKRDFTGALADYDQGIALAPDNVAAYGSRGVAKDVLGDFEGARADYAKSIELNPARATYVRFRLALILRRQGADDTAAGLGAAVAGWSEGWTKTVGAFLAGTITEADFLAAAAIGDSQTVRGQQCEAYYYAGMLRLLNHDPARARDLFERCTATGVAAYQEFALAQAEIDRLAGAGAAPRVQA